MSEPRLISPILDGFEISNVIRQHDGVLSCAVREIQSDSLFMLKILSIPASAVQMDAMLMTGAFSGRTEANAYYKEQARSILNEAKTLRHLTTLGGFTDFDCVQVVPAASGSGFEVYLLSPWRQSLEQLLQKDDLTQLEVLNMALDLCAALVTCRHAGYFYANLKPSNVFQVGQHYRIGDLGFLPFSAVNRVSLPEPLRSGHTPPELKSGTRPVNDSADVYALGLLLYEAFNGGVLPGEKDIVGQLYAPPAYADYELAQIILRACAPDPAIRWKDPAQMGHALTRYLQRNGMRNAPVVPPILQELAAQNKLEEFLPEYPDEAEPEPKPAIPAHNGKKQDIAAGGQTPSLPVRRRKTAAPRRWSTGKIAIAILAIVLIIELLIGIIVLGQQRKNQADDGTGTQAIQPGAALVLLHPLSTSIK